MEGEDAETHFAQKLASNEKKIRDRAMKRLHKYMSLKSSHGGLSDEDLLKIWKGLFYCMWMQDKPLIQEELSKRITSLVGAFSSTSDALRFVKVFLSTHAREWHGIDRLRLDKFLLMIREMLQRTLTLLSGLGWPQDQCRVFSQLLAEVVMRPKATRLPDGLRTHMADIFVDELKKVDLSQLSTSALVTLLMPFMVYVVHSQKIELARKMMSAVVCEMVDLCREDEAKQEKAKQEVEKGEEKEEDMDVEKEEDQEDEEEESPPLNLKVDYTVVLSVLFRMSQAAEVRAQNRAAVYGLVKRHPQALNREDDDEILGFLNEGKAMDQGDDTPSEKKKKKKRKFPKEAEEGGVEEGVMEVETSVSNNPKTDPNPDTSLQPIAAPGKKKKKKNKSDQGQEVVAGEEGGGNKKKKKKSNVETSIPQQPVEASVDQSGCGDSTAEVSSVNKKKKRKRSEEIIVEDSVDADVSVQKNKKKRKLSDGGCDVAIDTNIPSASTTKHSPGSAGDQSGNSATIASPKPKHKKLKKSQSTELIAEPTTDNLATTGDENSNKSVTPSPKNKDKKKLKKSKSSESSLVESFNVSPSPMGDENSNKSLTASPKSKDKKKQKKSKSSDFLVDATANPSISSPSLNKNCNAPNPLLSHKVEKVVYKQKQSSASPKFSASMSMEVDGPRDASKNNSPSGNVASEAEGSTSIFSTPKRLKKALTMTASALYGKSMSCPKASTPADAERASYPNTPTSKKKVIFDLRKNKANKFKDYIKSLKTPVTAMTPPPYDPNNTPSQSILKPAVTPPLVRTPSPKKSRRLSEPTKKNLNKKSHRSRSPLDRK